MPGSSQVYRDPIKIVKGFRRKSFSQSPFTIQAFINQIGLLCSGDRSVAGPSEVNQD